LPTIAAMRALPPLSIDLPREGHLRGVLDAARALRAARVDFAALVVVAAHGSTYRKPGAIAVVDAARRATGVLSGGCLDAGLADAALRVIASGRAERLVLDTTDDGDLVFGSGSGCRGRLEIDVLPQRAADPDLLGALAAQLEREPRAQFAGVEIRAPARALLLGAGPEAPPLVRLLRGLGWFVFVADDRGGLLEPERLAGADRLVAAKPGEALASCAQPLDAAIVMNHRARADREALEALASCDVGYVGLLGPRARREELVAQLAPAAREALLPRLHGPAGLDLGGEGPEAIALSIAAALHRHVCA